MARLFVRLKLALIGGGFRRGWQQMVGMLVAWALLLPAGLALGVGVAIGGRVLEQGSDVVLVAVALTGLLWIVGPPLFFGIDETLDPGRLALFPLTRRQLVVGMTAASLIGTGPTMTALVLLGAVVGSATSPVAAVLALVAAALQLAACVLAGRAVTTALSVRLRSRRGRDLAGLLLVLGIVVVSQGPNLLFNALGAEGLETGLQTLAQAARLIPPGWAGTAMAAAAEDRLLESLGWLVATAGYAAVLGWWWVRGLETLTSRPEQAGPAKRADDDLIPRWAAFLPANRLGAAAARELRYTAREPRYRLAAIIQAAFSIAIVVSGVITFGGNPRAVLVVGALAFPLALGTLNAFGADSGATWLLVAVGGDHRADLAGKNLGSALAAAPFALVAALVAAAITGGWWYMPVALLLLLGAYLCACGVGNTISVIAPFAQPELAGNVFGSRSGANALTALLQVAAIVSLVILLSPVVVGTLLAARSAPGWLAALALATPFYGAAIAWIGVTFAARRLASHGPEVLSALNAQRA